MRWCQWRWWLVFAAVLAIVANITCRLGRLPSSEAEFAKVVPLRERPSDAADADGEWHENNTGEMDNAAQEGNHDQRHACGSSRAVAHAHDGGYPGILHPRVYDGHQPVLVVHMHKAGGTMLCQTMRQSGRFGINMHGSCNIIRRSGATCSDLAKWAQEKRLGMFFIEWYLAESLGECSQFYKVVLLRDPVDRLVSLINRHRLVTGAYGNHEVVHQLWRNESFFKSKGNEHPWGDDNFYIRMLLGERLAHWKKDVTQEHMHLAMNVLSEKFGYVMIMDCLSDDLRALGVALDGRPIHAASGRFSNAPWNTSDWLLSDAATQKIKTDHALDIELYKWIKRHKEHC